LAESSQLVPNLSVSIYETAILSKTIISLSLRGRLRAWPVSLALLVLARGWPKIISLKPPAGPTLALDKFDAGDET